MRVFFVDNLIFCGFRRGQKGHYRAYEVAIFVIEKPDFLYNTKIHLQGYLTLDVAGKFLKYLLFVTPNIIFVCTVKDCVSYFNG